MLPSIFCWPQQNLHPNVIIQGTICCLSAKLLVCQANHTAVRLIQSVVIVNACQENEIICCICFSITLFLIFHFGESICPSEKAKSKRSHKSFCVKIKVYQPIFVWSCQMKSEVIIFVTQLTGIQVMWHGSTVISQFLLKLPRRIRNFFLVVV